MSGSIKPTDLVRLGADMWLKVAPSVFETACQTAGHDDRLRTQLWAGFLSSFIGSLASEFGKDAAVALVIHVNRAAARGLGVKQSGAHG